MNVEFWLKVNIRKNKFWRAIFYSCMMASVLKFWLSIGQPKFFNQQGEAKTAGKNGEGTSGVIRKHFRWIKNENRLIATYPPSYIYVHGIFWAFWPLILPGVLFKRGRGVVKQTFIEYEMANIRATRREKMNFDTINIEKAVVGTHNSEGRGILLKKKFIITAAHCVPWTSENMALYLYNYVEIEKGNIRIKVNVMFLDPISDIAILGPADDQNLAEHYFKFYDFCKNTPVVDLAKNKYKPNNTVKLYLWNRKTWIEITAQPREGNRLWCESSVKVESGCSGGPIVNEDGQLISIVSVFSEGLYFNGYSPIIPMCLPKWILMQL